MKKLLAVTSILLAFLLLAACSGVTVGSFSSKYLSSEDYDTAVEDVQVYFKSFEGCTLTKIGYAGDDAVKAEAEARGLAPEQVIVLTSTFETDGEDHGTGFEPNQTYEDYKWILTRGSSADLWEIADHG